MGKITKINDLIEYENLKREDCCFLLEVKRDYQYGDVDTKKLSSLPLIQCYEQYLSEISCWLSLPEDEIMTKIRNKEFNDTENKFILTNILLSRKESDEDEEY